MNQLNNYNLKKVTLILIAVILLAIPNIHTYSFIGSYQKTSKAITANKKYLCLANDNRKIVFDLMSEMLAPLTVTYGIRYYYDGHYTSQKREGYSKQHNPYW